MSSGPPALALAEQAYGLVQADPEAAATLAQSAIDAAVVENDAGAQVAALHALAWAQHVLGDDRALRTARRGIRLGVRSGDRVGVALLRRRLSISLAFAGDVRGAKREIDAAIADLSGSEKARSEVFRVAVLRAAPPADAGSHRAALAQTAAALRRLKRDRDEIWEARLLYNRGLLHSDRGELDAAEIDLLRARSLYGRLGARAAAADATVALAEIALYRGDLVEYLRVSDTERAALPPGDLAARMADHRAAALTQARLLPEARLAAEECIEHLRRGGYGDMVAAAELDLASIAILSGEPDAARAAARSAARSLAARGKPVEAALARLVVLRAEVAGGRVGPASLPRALEAVSVLEGSGWELHALRARLVAARVALATCRFDAARRLLAETRPLGRRGTLPDRIEHAHVTALAQAAGGDPARALTSLRRGLGLLEQYRAGFGAIELRSTTSGLGDELARLGLQLALDSGRPAAVLVWAERARASALRLPPVRPPSDPELRSAQAELRQVAEQLRTTDRQGAAHRRLAARRRTLEQSVRERVRYVAGGAGTAPEELDREALARAAGDRVLVEYVALDDRLVALVLQGRRLRAHELHAKDVENELGWLRFSLTQLAQARERNHPSRASVEAAAHALDDLLLQPFRATLGEAPLVVAPTGLLHALPWSALPSLRGRPVVVAPSLTTWLGLTRRPRRRHGRTALAAGPRLRHAGLELQALASVLPGATVLHRREATVAAALGAFDGAAIAHVACHGRFRSDNPLFSSLELADGPLTALDLQQLRSVPDVVVLSACDLALSELHPGDELLGFSAALLAMGTRTIVASVVPVPDAATRRLMVEFHRLLAGGLSPSVALARAQADAAVPGFVCLGAG